MVIKSSYVMRNYHKSCWQSKTASIVYFVWQNVKYWYGKKCCIFAMRQNFSNQPQQNGSSFHKNKDTDLTFWKNGRKKSPNLCCKPFLKYSQMFIESTPHPPPPSSQDQIKAIWSKFNTFTRPTVLVVIENGKLYSAKKFISLLPY